MKNLCKFCKNRLADFEVNIDLKDFGAPPIPRTWIVCNLNGESFPWAEECDDYQSISPGDDSDTLRAIGWFIVGNIIGVVLLGLIWG